MPPNRRSIESHVPITISVPLADVVPTVTKLFAQSGGTFNWDSPNVFSQIPSQHRGNNTPIVRLAKTLVAYNTAETEEGFRLISQSLSDFIANPDAIKERPREWFLKTALVESIIAELTHRHTELASKLPFQLREVASKSWETGCDLVRGLSKDDMTLYVTLYDMYNYYIDISIASTKHDLRYAKWSNRDKKRNAVKKSPPSPAKVRQKTEDPEEEAKYKTDFSFFNELWGSPLLADLNWKDIQTIIAFLPDLKSERFLFDLLFTDVVTDTQLPSEPIPSAFDAKGIVTLLGTDWKKLLKLSFEENPPFLKTPITAPGFSVPRIHLPPLVIQLLSKEIASLSKEDVYASFSAIHQEVQNAPRLRARWLTTLTALRAMHPDTKSFIDKLINNWNEIPQEQKDILLDTQAGRLWFTPDGRIRISAIDRELSDAFQIYTSSANPEDKSIPVSIPILKERGEKDIPLVVSPDGLVYSQFLGPIGIASQKAEDVIKKAFRQIPDSQGAIVQALTDVTNLMNHSITTSPDTEIVFLEKLNQSDSVLNRMGEYNIEAIYQRGNVFIFVFKESVGFIQTDENNIPVAVIGKLTKYKELKIAGMPDSFSSSPVQLYLNILALHCTTRDLKRKGNKDFRIDQQLERQLQDIETAWNNEKDNRNRRIQVATEETDVIIPARLPKDPFTVIFQPK